MDKNVVNGIFSGIRQIFFVTISLLVTIGIIALFIASPDVRNIVLRFVIVLIFIGVAYGAYSWAKDEGQERKENSLWKVFGVIFLISLFVYTLRSTKGCDTSNYYEDARTGTTSGEIFCPEYIEEQHRESAKKNAIYFFIASSAIAAIGYSRGTKPKEQTKKEQK